MSSVSSINANTEGDYNFRDTAATSKVHLNPEIVTLPFFQTLFYRLLKYPIKVQFLVKRKHKPQHQFMLAKSVHH